MAVNGATALMELPDWLAQMMLDDENIHESDVYLIPGVASYEMQPVLTGLVGRIITVNWTFNYDALGKQWVYEPRHRPTWLPVTRDMDNEDLETAAVAAWERASQSYYRHAPEAIQAAHRRAYITGYMAGRIAQ